MKYTRSIPHKRYRCNAVPHSSENRHNTALHKTEGCDRTFLEKAKIKIESQNPVTSITQKDAAISAIAQNLNLYTLQGVAVSPTGFVVPTLDGTLLHINLQGAIVTLVDLQKVDRGIPFGIATHKTDWVVTTSDYFPNHYLVRVKPDGTVTTIADLSELLRFPQE
jgi:hypothetical protein